MIDEARYGAEFDEIITQLERAFKRLRVHVASAITIQRQPETEPKAAPPERTKCRHLRKKKRRG